MLLPPERRDTRPLHGWSSQRGIDEFQRLLHLRAELVSRRPLRRFGQIVTVSRPLPVNEVDLVDHLINIAARNVEQARRFRSFPVERDHRVDRPRSSTPARALRLTLMTRVSSVLRTVCGLADCLAELLTLI